MSVIEIRVPDIGDFKDVAVIELLVQVGDTVKTEQSLFTVESDKASMEIPSPADGVVKELKVKIGDKINIGDLVAILEGNVAAAPAVSAPAAPKTEAAAPAAAPAAASAAPAVPNAPAPGSAGKIALHDVPDKTAAMLMAIVADRTGKPLNQLRFISIREVKD